MLNLRPLAFATLMLAAVAPVRGWAATYSCVEVAQNGEAARSVIVQLDPDAMTASAPTREGLGEGILQTTTDLYISRLRAPTGRAFLLTLHRHTGQISILHESPANSSERVPEFAGVCVPN